MVISVMSAIDAENETQKICNLKTAIISITDTNKPVTQFQQQPWLIAILRLQFDDVVADKDGRKSIVLADALKVRAFVEALKDSVERIIVHCKAGTSRSPGVAAAITKALGYDDLPIFRNRMYYPNMVCYREVLRAFLGEINDDKVDRRERINRLLWIP